MRLLILFLTGFLFASCARETEAPPPDIPVKSGGGIPAFTPGEPTAKHGVPGYLRNSGIQGVQRVPEILCIAVKDTAHSEEDISRKVDEGFKLLHNELGRMNMKSELQGVLFYTNDPKNFIFKCVIPINRMPATKPVRAELSILESTRAVVYNYYGAYSHINKAYEDLNTYLATNKLKQSGPAREFYITDPLQEPDTSKWLSRIYIPVK